MQVAQLYESLSLRSDVGVFGTFYVAEENFAAYIEKWKHVKSDRTKSLTLYLLGTMAPMLHTAPVKQLGIIFPLLHYQS